MAKTNSNIQAFQFADGIVVRSVIDDNQSPWFVAADVCTALDIANTTNALKRLDADEQALHTIKGMTKGNDQVNFINESGLYSLILTSRKAEAKRFKKWVTSEVLPAIRKTGSYQQVGEAEKPLALPDHTRRHVWLSMDSAGNVRESVELANTDAVRKQVDKHFPQVALLDRGAVVEDLDHVADLLLEMSTRVRNTLNPLITVLGTPTNSTAADVDAFWSKRKNNAFRRMVATIGDAA